MTIALPEWAPTARPAQVVAIQDTLEAFSNGTQVVILDAPTGSGKTLIGEMVRQYLDVRALYLCNSLALQDQFARDFPAAAVLKGRTNYATADSPSKFPQLNAGDCAKRRAELPACYDCDPNPELDEGMHCQWCHPVIDCPYERAKAAAIRSSLVCTNTAYFLFEANYVGNLPLARKLVIIDEADTLEDVLMSFVEVSLTQRKAEEYGIRPPTRKTVESAWVEWAVDAENVLSKYRVTGDTIAAIRARNSLNRLRGDIKRLNDPTTGLATGGWVYTGYDHGHIAFKPININHVARDYIWRHSPPIPPHVSNHHLLRRDGTYIGHRPLVADLKWRIKFYCPVPLCEWHSEPMHPQSTHREGQQYEKHYVKVHMPKPGVEQILPDPIIE